jgi:hypothetical protein
MAHSSPPQSATQAPREDVPVAPTAAEVAAAPLFHLPFAVGFATQVFLGNGEETHADRYNWNAIDFAPLDVGTPVLAMAAGRVVHVKEDAVGPTGKVEDNNEIAIALDDGSVAVYHHLMHEGADVAVGDRVLAGDPIGRSGNTGLSAGPHLHVDRRERTRLGRSLPLRFAEAPAGDGVLRKGDRVVSRNRLRIGPLAALLDLEEAYELCVALDARGALAAPLGRLLDAKAQAKAAAELGREAERGAARNDVAELHAATRARLLGRWNVDGAAALEAVDHAAAEYTAEDALLMARVALQDYDGSAVEKELRARLDSLGRRATAAPTQVEPPFRKQAAFTRALAEALTAELAARAARRDGKPVDARKLEAALRAARRKGNGRAGIEALDRFIDDAMRRLQERVAK